MPMSVQLLGITQINGQLAQPLTSFLINDSIAIDAGSFGIVLPAEQIAQLRHVVLTHAHLDHIVSLPIGLIESHGLMNEPLLVHGLQGTLSALRQHLLSDQVWLDLTRLPLNGSDRPMITLSEFKLRQTFDLEGVRFTAIPVHHTAESCGLIVESNDGNLIFTSDTGLTEELWEVAGRLPRVDAVFIDCSFPEAMESTALKTGHLTPRLVLAEINKLTSGGLPMPMVYCVHMKPSVREKVADEIVALGVSKMEPMMLNHEYHFG